jgi:hypothetical protein
MTEEHRNDFPVNVMIYSDEGEWCALALEMDVRGYGATADAAVADLVDMLHAQVSFAIHNGHPESVWHRSDDQYWQMWERARRSRFMAETSGAQAAVEEIAESLPLDLFALKHDEKWIAAGA